MKYFLKNIAFLLIKYWQWHLAVLICVWLLLQGICFAYFGAITSFDSSLYIEQAQKLLTGKLPEGREFFYISYCLVLAGVLACNLQVLWVVLFQVMMSLFSLIALYRLVAKLSKNPLMPFLTAFLYVCWFKFYQWNLIVYTDALFSSMVIISMYLWVYADTKAKQGLALLSIFFTGFIRPVGLLFLIAFSLYALTQLAVRFGRRKILFLGFLLIMGILSLLNNALEHFIPSILESYAKAEVIYPNIPLWIQPPAQVHLPEREIVALFRWLLFMLYQPWYMLRLSTLKLVLFLGHAKPYYSWGHNLLIACFLYPLYFFAVKAILKMHKPRFFVFIITFIGLQTIMVALTSENWDGRFLLPLLPWVFMLASFEICSYTMLGKSKK